jgi:hypothetical protein
MERARRIVDVILCKNYAPTLNAPENNTGIDDRCVVLSDSN